MLNLYTRLTTLRRQRGLTSVEYAVAGGLIVLAIAVAVALFDTELSTAFTNLFDKVNK